MSFPNRLSSRLPLTGDCHLDHSSNLIAMASRVEFIPPLFMDFILSPLLVAVRARGKEAAASAVGVMDFRGRLEACGAESGI